MDACYEMMGGFIANMYGGELAEGYYDVNSNTSPELTKYARNTGRPLAYSSMGMSTILFPRNVILQRLSEYFTIQLTTDLLQTEVTREAAAKVYNEHLLAKKKLYEWPAVFDADFTRKINEQLDSICSAARTALSYLDEDEEDIVFQDNIRNSLTKKIRQFYESERDAIKNRFMEYFLTNVETIGKKLISMDDEVYEGKGDITGALIFFGVVKENLKEVRSKSRLSRASDVFESHEYYDFEDDENPVIALVKKIPGLNMGQSTSREKWEEHLENEIVRIKRGFWELIINDGIGSELSIEVCVLREINRMIEKTRAIQERFAALLKNLVPNCNPNDENDLRFMIEKCKEPLATSKPEGKSRFKLMNYDNPANPSLFLMLWRVQDLYDFYHGNEALGLPGVVPVEETTGKNEKQKVKESDLLDKKREVLIRLLTEDSLGPAFSKVANMSVPRLKALIIAQARNLFKDQFARWDIEKAMNVMSSDGSLGTSQVISGLETMLRETDTFVQTKEGELGLAGVDGSENSNNSMSFIFLPNLYGQRPCASIKNSGEKKCPAQEDASIHCDKLGKCLKQVILNTSGKKISIIHPSEVGADDIETHNYEWYQLHEIHILKVFHGVPLQALEQQLSKGLPAYQKAVEEGRRMIIAGPNVDGLYYNLKAPFPNEEKKEYIRKIFLLFAGGLLRFDTDEGEYRFVTEKSYQRFQTTGSSLEYEGRLKKDEDLSEYIRKHPRIEGLVNQDDFRALFAMSDLLKKALAEPRYDEEVFEMYLRLVRLERDPGALYPGRMDEGDAGARSAERDLIHDLLGYLRAVDRGVGERYRREGETALLSVELSRPIIKA